MRRISIAVVALVMALLLAAPASADLARQVQPFEGEAPKLTIGFSNQPDYDADSTRWPTELFKYIREYMNVDLTFTNLGDSQQLQIALAGGDLPDVVMLQKDYLTQVLDAGLIVPMDDYLSYAPNLVGLSKLREAAMREYCSNGDGKWYFWTPQIGVESPDAYLWNGYTVRWDYYAELGYPKIASEDDYIAFMKAAVAAHPQTASGQKVWGYATYNDLWGWWVPGSFYGYHNITDEYHLRSKDSALINAYLDFEGPIWKQVAFCYKLNQEGLFDPDSFTMTSEDMNAKVANEQYVAIICQWYDKLYDIKRMEDPDTLSGYVTLPVEGQGNWSGANVRAGWSFYYGITTNCADPIIPMRMYDFFNSEEGARILLTGEQGRIWDYDANGTPVITQEAINNKATMAADEWIKWGGGVWGGIPGIGQHTVLSDGGKANLWKDRQMMAASLRPLDVDFCKHYGVELPYEAAYRLIAEGKAYDKSNCMWDLVGLLGTPPTEISRIDNNCREIITRALPELVLAADQAAYDAKQQAVIDELNAAGIQESNDWWQAAAAPIAAFVEANS